MELIHPHLAEHLAALAKSGDPVLGKMERRAEETGFPIVGPVAGRFCYQVAKMIGARRIFELGSGYGYSTLWFARAVSENGGGEVYHTVWDEDLSREAREYLSEAGLFDIVRFAAEEAVGALERTDGLFDLIFNDINKDAYPASLPLIKQKLRPGGALIIDNMLWGARIFDADDESDDTRGVREATRILFSDPDFFSSLLPLRDGLILSIKTDA